MAVQKAKPATSLLIESMVSIYHKSSVGMGHKLLCNSPKSIFIGTPGKARLEALAELNMIEAT